MKDDRVYFLGVSSMQNYFKHSLSRNTLFSIIIIYYVIIALAIGYFAWTPQYIEGDDARTILYHLMGRNVEIQNFYAAYHSGFDFLLSTLNADEQLLRYVAFGVSYIFGFLSIITMLYWLWFCFAFRVHVLFVLSLALPFLIPELIFNSLTYNPSSVAMTFSMAGVICFHKYILNRKSIYILFIFLFFGIGVSFRWSFLMFLSLPVSLYFLEGYSVKEILKNWSMYALLTGCIIAIFTGIYITGFIPADIFDVFLWGKSYVNNADRSLLGMAATALSVFTPAFVLCMLCGVLIFFKKYSINGLFAIIVGMLLPIFMGLYPSLKAMLPFFPLILLILVFGVEFFLTKNHRILSFVVIILFPWFLGVQNNSCNSAYGPGFEFENWKNVKFSYSDSKNPDKKKQCNKFRLGIHSGFAMPTPEGSRPLYGYAAVLFGGDWRRYVTDLNREREDLIERTEISQNSNIILLDREFALMQTTLFSLGFVCSEAFQKTDKFKYRVFDNGVLELKLIVPKGEKYLNLSDFARENFQGEYIRVCCAYSSGVTNCLNDSSFVRAGPFTGVFDYHEGF